MLGLAVLVVLSAVLTIVLLISLWILTGQSHLILGEGHPTPSLSQYFFLSLLVATPLHILNRFSAEKTPRKVFIGVAALGLAVALLDAYGCGHLDMNQISIQVLVAQLGILVWPGVMIFFGLFTLMFDVTLSYAIHDMLTEMELAPLHRRGLWYHMKLYLLRIGQAFEQYSDNDLNRHSRMALELMHLVPMSSSTNAAPLYVLSQTHWTVFQQTRQLQDLYECIDRLREALHLCPRDESPDSALSVDANHPIGVNRHTYMALTLGRILYLGFAATGRMELLDAAVVHFRDELSYLASNNPLRPHLMYYLASTYVLFNRPSDIESAIELFDAILALQPEDTLHFAVLVFKVETVGGLRAVGGRDVGVLEACQDLRAVLAADGAPSQLLLASGWSQLCETLSMGSGVDVDDAVECGRRALALCNSGGGFGDSVRFTTLLRLSRALLHPTRPASVASKAEAQKLLHTAQRYLNGPDDPRWALIWNEHARTQDDIERAVEFLQRSTSHATAAIRVRLDAARIWTYAAQRSNHTSILAAYATYIDLLDNYLMSMPSLDEQRETLGRIAEVPTLGMDAAAAAVNVGAYEQAIELFERGRGMLWARMRGYRGRNNTLMDLMPRELARKFLDINRELEAHARVRDKTHDVHLRSLREDPAQPIPLEEQSVPRQQRELLRQRAELLVEIRRLDGLEHFLEPTPFHELKQAAVEGPVIIVNVSHIRCDALIVSLTLGVTVVPLSGELFSDIPALATEMQSAVRGYRYGVQAQWSDLAPLEDVLRRLWDLVAGPIKDRLDLTNTASGTRVWWCPTSHLCAMPIHAAGHVDRDVHFCDYYLSSYTASLSALISARSGMETSVVQVDGLRSTDILLIGQQAKDIPAVRAEIAYIQTLSSKAEVNVQSCVDANALPSTVLRQLGASSLKGRGQWVHFACHASIHPDSPFQSYFQLYGREKLTLVDLMDANLPNAELAFLAVCHSASSHQNIDEALHLASAMQFIGFRSVVGTLWAMMDADGPVVAETFYGHLLGDNNGVSGSSVRSAEALDRAVKVLRANKVPLNRWVNFIHIGA